ncbi:MAG TPA: TonB-dependent receptor [Thermoanaerobaculia bacterium]|nr:TonB-dependent receptor [Thermoanaerobaculia bacterium]
MRPDHQPRGTPSRRFQLRLFVLVLVFVLALALLPPFAGHSAAQQTGAIVGTVLDAAGQPAAGVVVSVPDGGRRQETDESGAFRFEGIPSGSHLVIADGGRGGRSVETAEVEPGGTAELTLVLRLAAHTEEVVVTGFAEARSPLDLATATTVLSGDELRLRLQSSLGETLEQEAGISSTFFGPGASRPVIRGQSGDRVRMLEGGIGVGDASAISPDHAVTADPGLAEQIEVIRGPATLLYGSSAIGGAVNVVDQRIPTYRASEPIRGTVDLRGGTVADERSGSIALDGGSGRFAWHVDALVRDADDYEIPGFAFGEEEGNGDGEEHGEEEHENPRGLVPNTAVESEAARAGGSWFFGDSGFVGVSVSGFDSLYGLPGGHGHEEGEHEGEEEVEEEGEEVIRIDMEQRRVDFRGERTRPFGAFSGLKVRVGATDYEHVELEGDEVGTLFLNESVEGRFELVQNRRGRSSGSVGLQLSSRDLEAIGAEAFLPPTSTDSWALFTFQEIRSREDLRWQLGARWESQQIDVAPGFPDRDHDGLSASLGLVWDFGERWSLAGSAARAVKLPAAEELYSEGLHIATQAFEIGDSELDEESSLGLDISLRRTEGRVTGELTLYRQDFDDYVFQAFTGDEEEGFPVVLYSQQDADFIGAELKTRIELWEREGRHLHLRLMGDRVEAKLADGGNLPRIPGARLGAGLHYHAGAIDGMVEVRRTFVQNDVAVNETPTDGFTFINASFGYRFTFGNQLLDLLVRGRNLLDEEARSHTSFLKDIAPLPGRDVSVGMRWWF